MAWKVRGREASSQAVALISKNFGFSRLYVPHVSYCALVPTTTTRPG